MPLDERKQTIMKILSEQQDISLSKLHDLLHYSAATIRRDVTLLEKEGLLRRTHGMIHSIAPISNDDPLQAAHFPSNLRSKHLIARRALQLISSGSNIILDSGTTTLELARLMMDLPVTVVTNSLEIPLALVQSKAQVISCGGLLQPNHLCFLGPNAESFFSAIQADMLFIGTEGVRNWQGLTSSSPLQYNIKQAMIKAAKRRIALFDLSKLNTASLFMFSDFSDIDAIITIRPSPDSREEEILNAICNNRGVEIIYADDGSKRMPQSP